MSGLVTGVGGAPNPYLDDDLVALGDMVARFAADRIAPGFTERDRTRVLDPGLMAEMGALGLRFVQGTLEISGLAESDPPPLDARWDPRTQTYRLPAIAYADLILLDYYPTTPFSAANLPWHILFGISGGHVHSTIAHGQTLMRERRLLTMDEAAITTRSRAVAQATWERYWAMF